MDFGVCYQVSMFLDLGTKNDLDSLALGLGVRHELRLLMRSAEEVLAGVWMTP